MSEPAPQLPSPRAESARTTWPHQLSHAPTLRVGDVLAALRVEFPSLSSSKLRFLDAQELVAPSRAASGYRQYSHADVERLRYVLRQQRDAYAPLGVIKERLNTLDRGLAHEPLSLAAAGDGSGGLVSIDDAARLAATTPEVVLSLADEGLVVPQSPGLFERSAVPLMSACAQYLEAGADMRELRALARAARREVEATRAAAAPLRRRDDRGLEQAARAQRTQAAGTLFSALLRESNPDGG
ncbi:MAG: MerR family transcriptional regulator [Demequina sp.]|uniref:transcriptional regulator FtsR n=1 Tax=Demequina sp. TaxID=2050685 RepID=UPI0019AEBD55|nr:MerR family transcriptional regulator [Demequina sp.]MBC7297754.1 MerR family transcriptional regulator [Demequina sp.]